MQTPALTTRDKDWTLHTGTVCWRQETGDMEREWIRATAECQRNTGNQEETQYLTIQKKKESEIFFPLVKSSDTKVTFLCQSWRRQCQHVALEQKILSVFNY